MVSYRLISLWLLLTCAACPGQRFTFRDPAWMATIPRVAPSGGGGGSSPFIISQTLGTLRNDFSSYVGFQFHCGQNSHITALGRWVVSGNSGSHTLIVADASCTTLASVTLNTSGQTAGQYAYVTLATPLAITSGSVYNVFSLEASGGDQWYNNDDTVTVNAAEGGSVVDEYIFSGSCDSSSMANTSYGPVNFQFTTP